MQVPNDPIEGKPIYPWARDVNRFLRATRITSYTGGRIVENPNGTALIEGTTPSIIDAKPFVCPFGKIVQMPEGSENPTGVAGGIVYCGDKNFNVDPYPIDAETPGAWLLYISVDCEAVTDDDNEIMLGGIATSSATSLSIDAIPWEEGTNYPDNTEPSLPAATGTCIVPIGKLTITAIEGSEPPSNAVNFNPVACGNATIGCCNGILSHTRG